MTNKTQKTKQSVTQFINSIENEQKRKNSKELLKIFKEVTGLKPIMWGNMIGFGSYHYKYASGREGDWFRTGFAARKASMTVYIMPGFKDFQDELSKIGKHKTSVSCLYFSKLDDLNIPILKRLIKKSLVKMKKIYG